MTTDNAGTGTNPVYNIRRRAIPAVEQWTKLHHWKEFQTLYATTSWHYHQLLAVAAAAAAGAMQFHGVYVLAGTAPVFGVPAGDGVVAVAEQITHSRFIHTQQKFTTLHISHIHLAMQTASVKYSNEDCKDKQSIANCGI